ncbi:hypothetical protein [Bacteroides heparinolyticus]|uniref:hypothetical protein n=1 Tax=Prevotella heparinolytica TaxID=28113 RepID=UPI0035A10DB0
MKLLIISFLLACSLQGYAQSRYQEVFRQIKDSINRDTTLSAYDHMVIKRYLRWSQLIPSQSILQVAGNMGSFSLGLGWDYGKREQWETHLLLGLIPKHDAKSAKMTMTLKQTFRPWQIKAYKDVYFDPLTAGIYLNTVFGKQFWGRQPDRYPQSYYHFLSTKIRINVFVGQQFMWKIPQYRRKSRNSIFLFYEVSTCDLYLRSYVTEKYVRLTDIIGLSIGAKVKFL